MARPAALPAPSVPEPVPGSTGEPDGLSPAGSVGADGPELPTLAPPPASPWTDGFGRIAVRSAQTLLVLGSTAIVLLVLVRLRLLVIPILIALLIAAALAPLVTWFVRRGLPRMLATWASLLLGVVALGLIGWAVVSGVRGEWGELTRRASEGFAELQRLLASGPFPIGEEQLARAREAVVELVQGEQVRSGAIAGATAAAEAVAGVLLGAVVLFFLLKDGPRIWEFLLRPLSGHRERRTRLVGARSVEVLGGYVRGTAIVALVDAVLIGLALVVLRVPLALPLALVVFVGAFIPLVGATLSGILAALVALVANGPIVALIVVAVVIAVNQIEGDVLAPVVLGRALSLHPLAILLALTTGTILAGIVGALLAVPIAAVAWSAISTWAADKRATADAVGVQVPPPVSPST